MLAIHYTNLADRAGVFKEHGHLFNLPEYELTITYCAQCVSVSIR